jgi:hypothetical protein
MLRYSTGYVATETTKYVVSARALAAITDEMHRRRWVDSAGNYQWSKVVDLLRERRALRISTSALSQAFASPGRRTYALRDILAALDLPTYLAQELEDVDRLLFEAAHGAGITDLSPAEQKEIALFLKRQVELMVAARAGPKK